MQISGLSGANKDLYDSMAVSASPSASRVEALSKQDMVQAVKAGDTEKLSAAQLKSLKRSGAVECATCASRKYKDGSDEGNVSFKTPGHIAPSASAGKVMAHEQEHVSNAYKDAAKNNGKVLSANVAIHTSICPECGRSYVSGGTTTTQIKYYNEDNPYQKNLKAADALKYTGMNLDMAV